MREQYLFNILAVGTVLVNLLKIIDYQTIILFFSFDFDRSASGEGFPVAKYLVSAPYNLNIIVLLEEYHIFEKKSLISCFINSISMFLFQMVHSGWDMLSVYCRNFVMMLSMNHCSVNCKWSESEERNVIRPVSLRVFKPSLSCRYRGLSYMVYSFLSWPGM